MIYSTPGLSNIWFIQHLVYPTFGLSNTWFIQQLVYPTPGLSNNWFIQHLVYPTTGLSNTWFIQQLVYPTPRLSNTWFIQHIYRSRHHWINQIPLCTQIVISVVEVSVHSFVCPLAPPVFCTQCAYSYCTLYVTVVAL